MTNFYGLYFGHHYTYYTLQIMLDLLSGQLYVYCTLDTSSLGIQMVRYLDGQDHLITDHLNSKLLAHYSGHGLNNELKLCYLDET